MQHQPSRRAREAERDRLVASITASLRRLPAEELRVVDRMTRTLADGEPRSARPRHEPEVPPLAPAGMEIKG